MRGRRPPKLGQHFLKDASALAKIVGAIDPRPGDTIAEIGPGHGELTKLILNAGVAKLIAIEKDAQLVAGSLRDLEATHTNFKVIEGDVLTTLGPTVRELSPAPLGFKLVGNIPYYLTGRLLRVVGELDTRPRIVVFTVQKEVGERLCAAPPRMNLLAASVGVWGHAEIVGRISKKSFSPMPQVDSAIIRITTLPDAGSSDELEGYYRFVRALFSQPRKTILNNIRSGFGLDRQVVEKLLTGSGLEPNLRPQNLSQEDVSTLARVFTRQEADSTL